MNNKIPILLFFFFFLEVIQLQIGLVLILFIYNICVTYISKELGNLTRMDLFVITLVSIFTGTIYTANWGFLLLIMWVLWIVDKFLSKILELGDVRIFVVVLIGSVLFQFVFDLQINFLLLIMRSVSSIIMFYLLEVIVGVNKEKRVRGYKI